MFVCLLVQVSDGCHQDLNKHIIRCGEYGDSPRPERQVPPTPSLQLGSPGPGFPGAASHQETADQDYYDETLPCIISCVKCGETL